MELQHHAREVHILNEGFHQDKLQPPQRDWNGLVLLLK